ncbi:acetate kinase [Clostridium thermobutyricum]|uniref:Acetate kinase n=1 Tax=Clostridium thermobutyricum TaxID=29372 RepID=N9WFX1_9CLOT|nr:acetate kinase [Clostridium thermobutyricum]ENZ01755.1 acetate kinase [Clostridium thermobutyricum]
MKILVINCGSSSVKYQLIDMSNEEVLAHGLVERIGIQGSILTQKVEGRDKYIIETPMENHKFAIKLVLDALVDEKNGVIKSMDEINAVGHRVVHGGEKYSQSVIIDENVMKELEACVKLAPLHNPPNIVGINACKALMPNVPMVAVFDTAFHQTMPEKAYMYAIPYEMYEKHGVRKYGFHGTSHRYVSSEVAKTMGKDLKDLKIITCHLGNGGSLAAIKNGECIDTSMGFTPLDGVVMGTRSGSIDPAVVLYMATDLGYSVDEINSILNKKSGVLGLSGISSDFRDLQDGLEKGNERATLALEVFRYSVKKQIGAYIAAMNGVDVIVFTAGLGENSVPNRKAILNGLEYLGIELDEERNDTYGVTKKISKDSSKVDVYVVPTNEELVIARDTLGLIK